RGVVGRRRRNHLLVNRRHAHRLGLLLGIVDFPARERDGHGGETDAHRLLRRLLDEGERRAAVVAAGVSGGAELQQIGGRGDLFGTNPTPEPHPPPCPPCFPHAPPQRPPHAR